MWLRTKWWSFVVVLGAAIQGLICLPRKPFLCVTILDFESEDSKSCSELYLVAESFLMIFTVKIPRFFPLPTRPHIVGLLATSAPAPCSSLLFPHHTKHAHLRAFSPASPSPCNALLLESCMGGPSLHLGLCSRHLISGIALSS